MNTTTPDSLTRVIVGELDVAHATTAIRTAVASVLGDAPVDLNDRDDRDRARLARQAGYRVGIAAGGRTSALRSVRELTRRERLDRAVAA